MRAGWREVTRVIIFEADTPAGKLFDVGLLGVIIGSVVLVMLQSVGAVQARYGETLVALEWAITILFSVEYGLRLASTPRPIRYARSFFGLVDLLAILPSYLSLVLPGVHSLLVIRALRLLRVFRVLKLVRYLGEANVLATALRSSIPKVVVFLGTVLVTVVIMGTAMYLIEGKEHGFTSIPLAVYWAIVTMTTVGYGDLSPQTPMGQMLAAVVMILGYALIAIPTGIVSAELVRAPRREVTTRVCPACLSEGHQRSARYCQDCGARLVDSSKV